VLVATPIDLSKKQNHRAGSGDHHLLTNGGGNRGRPRTFGKADAPLEEWGTPEKREGGGVPECRGEPLLFLVALMGWSHSFAITL
jgi:hypothetical protein